MIGFIGQIYGDFSGYSDMAIGFALLLGFRLPANFNYPYISSSLGELWRRWHISFSFWLRDYVYIPLGGSRMGRARKYLNLMITFVVSGIWHGTGLNYIIWGSIQGLVISLEDFLGTTIYPVEPHSSQVHHIFHLRDRRDVFPPGHKKCGHHAFKNVLFIIP